MSQITKGFLFVLLVSLLAIGCASSETKIKKKDTGQDVEVEDQKDSSGVDIPPDDVDLVPLDQNDVEEPGFKVEICVVNTHEPNGACSPSGELDLTAAEVGVSLVRYIRVTPQEGAANFTQVVINDPMLSSSIWTFDGGNEEEQTLPFPREDGRPLFFELVYDWDGSILDTSFVAIHVQELSAPLEVPIRTLAGTLCDPGMGDCDEDSVCETDLRSTMAHCGGCNLECNLTNADGGCEEGVCVFLGCKPDYFDTNNDLSDGCESYCGTGSSTEDIPDPSFVDANCDGMDGDPQRAIFVAVDGDDLAPGTAEAPLATLGAALIAASIDESKDHIYVSRGAYNESIVLVDGVSIFGAYSRDEAWRRDESFVVEITGSLTEGAHQISVNGQDIESHTIMSHLTITSPDAWDSGVSNYALRCWRCPGLELVKNTLHAGAAGDGSPGGSGIRGGDGQKGANGTNGSCNGSSAGSGGAGGTSPVGRTGGRGGNGGPEGDKSGSSGDPGLIGTPPGGGGSGGSEGGNGGPGDPGDDGNTGIAGYGGGPDGAIQDGYWVGESGETGDPGEHGDGGGGGGGGGGQGGLFVDNGAGNGGGGGGGGGQGGSGGHGGTPGGGSFGVLLVDSTGAILEQNEIFSSTGGRGGEGGPGGEGGSGGAKGTGSSHCDDEIGEGGDGGVGGAGGEGGAGGGGQGGVSYGIYLYNTEAFPWNNDVTNGDPGQGGLSSAGGVANGKTGASGTVYQGP